LNVERGHGTSSVAVAIYDRQRAARRYYDSDVNELLPLTESNTIHRYVAIGI